MVINKKQPIYQTDDHVLIHILSFLPYQEVCRVATLVNRNWKFFATHRLLWLSYIRQHLAYEITEYQSTQDYSWYRFFKELLGSSWKWRRAVSYFNVYDEHFRAMILGDKKCGKTGVLFRLTKTRFDGEEALKRGVSKFEMSYKTTRMLDTQTRKTVKLQIYDTNLEDMATYVKSCNTYLSLCHVVIFVFNVAKKPTFFNALQKWLYLVKRRNSDNYIMFLIGTNADKGSKRQVSYEEASRAAKENGLIYFEVNNLEKNDFHFHSITQTIVHSAYRKVIEKKTPFDKVNQLVSTIEGDKSMEIVRKKQVMLIPNPEPIDNDQYAFESDGEKEQKKDLDEIRLQEWIKQLRKDEQEDEDLKQSLKSPRPFYVQEGSATAEDLEEGALSPKIESIREERIPEPETPVGPVDEVDEPIEEVHDHHEDKPLEEKVVDPVVEHVDLSEWTEDMMYALIDDFGLISLNLSIPTEEVPDEGPEFWDHYIDDRETDDPSDIEKQVHEVLGINRVYAEKLVKAAEFDYAERIIPFDKQILQFAKKLRDDKELNDKLNTDEKNQLKTLVRGYYDQITKNTISKSDYPEKMKELELQVNRLVTAAFNRTTE